MGSELLSQGLQLMLIGMGTVFSFLIFLVFVTRFMSRIVLSLDPAPGPYAEMAGKFGVEESHVEAIALALEQHEANIGGRNG